MLSLLLFSVCGLNRATFSFLEQSSAVVSEVEDYSDNEATQEAVEVSLEHK